MSVQTAKYKPILFSERLAPNGAGAFTMCRGASLAMAFDAGTNGDWTTNPDGSRWGRAKIKNMLDRMRVATGEPQRDSYNQGHVPEFLKAMGAPPEAYQTANVSWADLIADLKSGFVVELAGNTRHTSVDSPLRKYVNPVDHDILMVDYKDGRIAFIDPMTPHGTARYIRWAPAQHFEQFASEFRTGGNNVAGRIKRGKYSEINLSRQRMAKALKDVSLRNEQLASRISGLVDENGRLDTQISTLEFEVASLQGQIEEGVSPVELDALLAQVAVIERATGELRNVIN